MSKEIIIAMIEMGRDELLRAMNAVPDDKLHWKPLDNGRDVLDLLGECAQTPAFLLHLLRKEELNLSPALFEQMAKDRAGWSREQSLQLLRDKTEEALALLRDFPDEELSAPLQLPLHGGTTLPLGAWALMLYRTFAARTAQINYIQTLYGDFEIH